MKKTFMLASALFLVSSLAVSMVAPALACRHDTDVGINISVPTPVSPGIVTLTITEENTGTHDAPLTNVFVELQENGVLIDTINWAPDAGDSSNPGTLDPDEIWTWYYDVTVTANTTYTVIGHGYIDYPNGDVTFSTGYEFEKESIDITVTENGDYEGLTPGYWRNHLGDWSGYAPTNTFAAVFGVGPGTTLGLRKAGTIWARGGGENALLRHATAALLNAAHPNIDYAFTEAEVIQMVQDAYASGDFEAMKDILEEQNELEGDISS